MRWGSWRGLLCFTLLLILIGLTAWAGQHASPFDHWWVPLSACAIGLVLLCVGRAHAAGGDPDRYPVWRIVPVYAVILCVFEPVMLVSPYFRLSPLLFALVLALLAWVGVTGLGRGLWVRAIGAWLVLFGQFFAMIFNVSHSDAGMGCYSGWVF
ncbi:MAG TPA: hypothetical protein VKE74_17195 [Gemmataceae bacterium]|nr:hypothetical protein [Gemmataceae bacterium]